MYLVSFFLLLFFVVVACLFFYLFLFVGFLILFSAFKSVFHCSFFHPNTKITLSKIGKICFSIAWYVIYCVYYKPCYTKANFINCVEKSVVSQFNKKTILVLPFSSVKLTTNT